jgi:hypothetical protein
MKPFRHALFIAIMCLLCSCMIVAAQAQVKAKAAPVAKKALDSAVTVLNPLGTPPPLELKSMAPRLDTMDGKTIYLVDDGYPGSDNLLFELEKGFKESYPKTNFHYVKKATFMAQPDPALWAEMKQKADAMVIALGH